MYVAMVNGDGFVFDSAGVITGTQVSSFMYATIVDSAGDALSVGSNPGPTKFSGFTYVCRVGHTGTIVNVGAEPGPTVVSGFRHVCLVDTDGDVLGTFGASSNPITAPVLTRTSSAGASPLTWTTAIDATVYSGYFWRLQVDQTSSAFGTLTQDITQMITPSEIAALDGSFPTFLPPSGLYFMRIRVEREDGTTSAWSNVLTDTITAATTTLNITTGANKNQYIAISGTPKLIGTGTNGVGASCGVRATAAATGKRQFELTYTTKVQFAQIGVEDGTTVLGPAVFPTPGLSNSLGITSRSDGIIYRGGAAVQTGLATWVAGDVISLEFDTVGGTASFFRNGAAYGTQLTGLSFSAWWGFVSVFSNDVVTTNFGQSAFTHALTSGYSMYG